MAQWDYADLSKAAKDAGGPKKYLELIEKASRKAGRKDMVPVIGEAIIVTAVTIKLIDYFKSKKKSSKNEIEYAKQELIQGIKEYDTQHKDDVEKQKEINNEEE